MSLRQKYLDVVSRLVTPGAVGMAVMLGSAVPAAASQDPQPTVQPGEGVSVRLAAIRGAVSDAVGKDAATAQERQLAWGNWGWGRRWRNWGWGGPWHNWNNWRNGWHNWGNGWGNW